MEMENRNAKTRILAIGDIHGDLNLVENLAKKSEKYDIDLVIFAGDITQAEQSVKGLIGPFAKRKKPVLIVPGNHESIATVDFLERAYENAKNLHGYSHVHRNIGFFGAGTANIGIHQIPDSEIFEMLKKGHSELDKKVEKKVMITHIHPHGSQSEKLTGFQGSFAVRKAIETFKPDFLINAHIHQAGGIEERIGNTTVFNVSRKERIFEI